MTIIYREVTQVIGEDINKKQIFEQVATIRIVGNADVAAFKTLINRAMNTWDNAPAELKEFADMVTEGKILQPYHEQK